MFGNHSLRGLLEEGTHEKSPKCLDGNLGDFGEFCKGLRLKDSAIEKAKQDRESSAAYQSGKAVREEKERVRYVQVQKIVEKPVFRNTCVDSDGLSIINAAIADGN